jgi:DNA polymerase
MRSNSALTILGLPRYICDFETYSELDVKDVGAARYAEHESTEILCLGLKKPGGERRIWYPGLDFPADLIDHVNAGYVIEAHNSVFEYWIWTFQLYHKLFIPMPQHWIDTLATCAYRGLPLGLDKVGEVLNLPLKKNKRGKYLLNKLSKPQRPTKKNPETRCTDFTLLEELYEYCLDDCSAEEALGDTIGDLSYAEYNLWCLDQIINRRGVKVDLAVVHKALGIVAQLTETLTAELQEITKDEAGSVLVEKATQRDRILEWCHNHGATGLANLQAEHLTEYLKFPWVPDQVRRVLEIRQLLGHASIAKLTKFSECVSNDGRIRGLLQYHGAGTGRWAGRLVQPQNFPRDKLSVDTKRLGVNADGFMDLLIQSIRTGDPDIIALFHGTNVLDTIATALRGMFIAEEGKKLFVADFAQIEARVVMWLAGALKALDAFRAADAGTGQDIYCQMASEIFRRAITKNDKPERQLGKVIILGCGYQMSGGKLRIQSETDLARVGIVLTEDEADAYVAKYRSTYPEVPELWKELEESSLVCVRTGMPVSCAKGRIRFEMVYDKAGHWLTMILPNGRRLWYFRPGIEKRTISYVVKKDRPEQNLKKGDVDYFIKECLFYEGRDNKKSGAWTRVYTYGGMLTENAVQAIARDLMAHAMFRAEKHGYPVVLTVHDELVTEAVDNGAKSAKEFEHIVRGPNPAWAGDCPVNAEAFETYRYRK